MFANLPESTNPVVARWQPAGDAVDRVGVFNFLSNGVQSYRNLLEGPLLTSQLIDEANLQFKVQVQEWKKRAVAQQTASGHGEILGPVPGPSARDVQGILSHSWSPRLPATLS